MTNICLKNLKQIFIAIFSHTAATLLLYNINNNIYLLLHNIISIDISA